MNSRKLWKLWKNDLTFCALGGVGIFIYYLPYFLLGQDAAFRISDFLDDEVVQYLLSGNYLFASSDTVVQEWLSGVPLASIQPPCLLLVFIFKFFPLYYAIIISSLFITIMAFSGMYLLCNHLLQGKEKYFSLMSALLFCILPFYPSYGLSSTGLPLVVWACIKLTERTERKYWLYYTMLILYTISSSLVWSGYFVIGFMMIAAFCLIVCGKCKGGKHIACAAIGMSLIYCCIFWNTISSVLFGTMQSHRNDPERVWAASDFMDNFISLFKYGQYHAPSLHTYIMALTLLVIILGSFFYSRLNAATRFKWKLAALLWMAALFIAFFYGFYSCEAGLAIRSHLGSLKSFQLDRIYWIYPMLWYVELAICASIFVQYVSLIAQKLYKGKEWNKIITAGSILAACIFTAFYANYIIHHPNSAEYYSNVCKVLELNTDTNYMSYHEFYDHELFTEIKDYIGQDQSEYRVACLGLVPAIASVNGFYTVDAYSTNYPLEYKYEFREVISEELNKNEILRNYYDNWGSRCYLFSAELGMQFQVLKTDNLVIQTLDIDTEKLKSLGCKYIFSAVEVKNAAQLNMSLQNIFSHEDSAIEIYLYYLE